MYITETAKRKVQNLLRDTNDCIEYPILNKNGYGLIQGFDNNDKKVHMMAHRVSYQLYYNIDITSDQLVCHTCDNPKCINPKHLFLGTNADNQRDKCIKNRQAKGSQNGRYIDGRASDMQMHHKRQVGNISPSKVYEVKVLKSQGIKLTEIAKITGVPYQTVKDISCGRVYKD